MLASYDLLVSSQLGFLGELDLVVRLEWLSLGPECLVLPLLLCPDAFQLRTLVEFSIPLLISDITSLVLPADDEDSVAHLHSPCLAAVDSATGGAELFGVLVDQLLCLLGPLSVTGRNHCVDETHPMLGHSFYGLAVERGLGDRLELVECLSIEVEKGRSGGAMRPETGEAGRRPGLKIARKKPSRWPHDDGFNWLLSLQ